MDDPDVILAVDGHAGDRSQNPVIGQRLRPERIDLIAAGRLRRGCGRGLAAATRRSPRSGQRPANRQGEASRAAIVARRSSLHRISADGREYTATRRALGPRGWCSVCWLASSLALRPGRPRTTFRPASSCTRSSKPEGQRLQRAAARAARRDARLHVPGARRRAARSARACDPMLGEAATHLARPGAHGLRGGPRARRARARRDAHLAAVRSIVRELRRGARASSRPAAGRRDGAAGHRGAARRAARVPDRLGPRAVFDRSAVRALRPPRRDHAPVSDARTSPNARSSSPAIPGSCGSIRAGIRRR